MTQSNLLVDPDDREVLRALQRRRAQWVGASELKLSVNRLRASAKRLRLQGHLVQERSYGKVFEFRLATLVDFKKMAAGDRDL